MTKEQLEQFKIEVFKKYRGKDCDSMDDFDIDNVIKIIDELYNRMSKEK